MPRGLRLTYKNAIYHVFNRGINKQKIFLCQEDYLFFLRLLLKLKKKFDHSVFALCIMPSHFHLLIKTHKVSISKVMASLMTSYSMYFNNKYQRVGPLFQNRFKSILVENDSYFFQLSQYIYLNPVRAGLVDNPLDYEYSSIKEVLKMEPISILDKSVYRIIGESDDDIEAYKEYIFDGLNNLESLREIENLL